MEIINYNIENLRPYEKNARLHGNQNVEAIINSITEFGFNDPVGIWGDDNIIVEGHGRVLAAKRLGLKIVPCIRLDHLNDEQRRAYALAHNKTAELSEWDFEILAEELNDISIDTEDFNLSIPKPKEKKNARENTYNEYNLYIYDELRTSGKWQMPIIRKTDYIPSDLIGFNYALSNKDKNTGIHCFVDDYQIERLWNRPDDYIETLSEYECFLSPDYSLYLDMPLSMKIWNIYRSRLIGQYYQDNGIEVIPTVSWAEPETFEFVFDGLEQGGTIAVSTIGVKRKTGAAKIFKQGMTEMLKRLSPDTVLLYGGEIDFDFGGTKIVYYENKVTAKFRKED